MVSEAGDFEHHFLGVKLLPENLEHGIQLVTQGYLFLMIVCSEGPLAVYLVVDL